MLRHERLRLRPVLPLAAAAMAILLPATASAHVKWFAPYDVTAAPRPMGGVLTHHFLLALGGFALLVFAGFLVDRFAARSTRWQPTASASEDSEDVLLRAGIGGFFMAIFAMGGMLLTPELHTTADWPGWLQFGIAISMLSRRTCFLGAIGIVVLYGTSVALYGVFHLTDYPMFLGIAAYLALTSTTAPRLRALRTPILSVTFCVSLMWAAIEKWAYPQWTFPVLAARPYLTLDIPSEDFMVIAGFVEFALAYYIMTGLGLLRLGILALGLIFVSAILDFGKLDAIGHLPNIVVLAVLFKHGPTRLHHWMHDTSRSLFAEAHQAGFAFVTAIALFFGAYYGLQHAEYGHGTPGPFAALASDLTSPFK
jgi:hypothetical protein